jgi:hypothetical protein
MISDAVKLSTVERLIATRRPFPRALRERFERDTREGSGPSSNRRSSFTIFYSRRTCFRPGRMAGLSGDSRGDRDAAHGRRRSRHSAAQIAHGPRDRCRDPAARDEPAVLFVFAGSASPFSDHYQYLVLLNMLLLGASLRPRFSIVLVVSSFVFVLHFAAVQFLSDMRWQAASIASLVLLVVVYTTTMAASAHSGASAAISLSPARELAPCRGGPFIPPRQAHRLLQSRRSG